ncbi:MAG: M50 family metallopeptidase [Acidimicrobiia bacterium]
MTETAIPDEAAETAAESRKALIRLMIGLGIAAFLTVSFGVGATVLIVVAFLLMIMLHELGHYLTAKWAGMKVTEFFLGFGPRIWSVRRGETEYGIKAIPAGGYVKIIGMHNLEVVDANDEPRTYRQQPFWRRLSVAVAGSTMHFIIAFVLLFVILAGVGLPVTTTTVGQISAIRGGRSPAQEAGFRVGDRILAVDGEPLEAWEDLPPYIRQHPGDELRFTVERDGEQIQLTAVPADLSKTEVEGMESPSEPTGFVGIGPKIANERVPPLTAVGESATTLGRLFGEVFRALGSVFSFNGLQTYGDVLLGRTGGTTAEDGGNNRFLSPVGFVRVAGQAAESGLADVLFLLVSINLFVGVFNMVPLLPLDGGHVVIAVYEKIRSMLAGRRYYADVAKLMPLTYMVVLLLLFLGLTSLWLDITNPIDNPFQ